MAIASNNNINTTLGTTVTSTVNQVFTEYPYLNQIFTEEVTKCIKENALSQCDSPPTTFQLDNDITAIDGILEFLIINEYYNKDTLLFMYEIFIKFLKAKKCVQAQYPCYGHDYYNQIRRYIDNFEFTPLT